MTNKLLGIMTDGKLVNRTSIRYLDDAVFGIGVSAAKVNSGALAVKDNEMVVVEYVLADGLTYVSDTSGVAPAISGQTLKWTFPSNAGSDETYFFSKQFNVTAKVATDLPYFSKITNSATTSIPFVDGSVMPYTANATVMISPNMDTTVPPALNGSGYSSLLGGPKDGFGNAGGMEIEPPDVTDSALLGWRVYMTPMTSTNPKGKLGAYDWFFLPDNHQTIKQFYSGDFTYRPSNAFPAGVPLDEPVHFSMSIKYEGSNTWEKGIADVQKSTWYTAEQLGIDPDRRVAGVWMHFNDGTEPFVDKLNTNLFSQKVPAGLTSSNVMFYTQPDKGYIGTLSSDVAFNYLGWNNASQGVSGQSPLVPLELVNSGQLTNLLHEAWFKNIATKSANVVEPADGKERVVRGQAYLADQSNGLVEAGDNTLKLQMTNDQASLKRLEGPFTAYALLDPGISVKDLSGVTGAKVSLVTSDFQATGKTLIKVEYAATNLTAGMTTAVSIPVSISKNAPYSLGVRFVGYLNADFEVPDTANADGSFTVKVRDELDLNGNGDVDENVYQVKQSYMFVTPYEYFGQILGTDKDGSALTAVEFQKDKSVALQFTLTSQKQNPFSTVSLIGVLPGVSDTRVISDEQRDSKFAANLTGPIELPAALKDSFKVLYSTSSEPKVAGVLDVNTSASRDKLTQPGSVDDAPWVEAANVSSFENIRSFMLVKTANSAPIADKDLAFTVELKPNTGTLTGTEAIADRTAFVSFATGVNDAQVFETRNFPLTLVEKKAPVVDPTPIVDPTTPTGGKNNGKLPKTGASSTMLIVGPVALLLVGAGLVLAKRRRETDI